MVDGADGWLGTVYYPDTKESVPLGQWPEIEEAKAGVEGWVRVVHGVENAIEWAAGLELRAKG